MQKHSRRRRPALALPSCQRLSAQPFGDVCPLLPDDAGRDKGEWNPSPRPGLSQPEVPSLYCCLCRRVHCHHACRRQARQSLAQHYGRPCRKSLARRLALPRLVLLHGVLPKLRAYETRTVVEDAYPRHQQSSARHSLCHRAVLLLAVPAVHD